MIHDDILGSIDDARLVRIRTAGGGASVVAAFGASGTGPATADAVALRAVTNLDATPASAAAPVLVTYGATFGASVAMIAAARRLACVVLVDDGTTRAQRNRITACGADLRVLPVKGGDDDVSVAARRVAADLPGGVLVEKPVAAGAAEDALATRLIETIGDGLACVIATERESPVLDALRRASSGGARVRTLRLAFDGVTWTAHTDAGPLLVSERDALLTARRIAAEQGLVGDAARGGAALAAALRVARELPPDATVVAFVPAADRGDLETAYDPAWWKAHHGEAAERLTAASILSRKHQPLDDLVTLAHDATVAHAIRIMRDLEVSQIPVVQDGAIVGTIREDQVIDLLLHANERKEGPVSAVMEDPLPEIDASVSVDELQALLVRGGSAVIVRRDDGGRDILTKYDLIHALTRG